ncbi:MAG: histone deacetylase, partial [Verrucomicrobiota bacterium]|nr:histone deacetylase [Verrucomicrobiota bacterium]
HGNGTEDILAKRDGVAFFSIHQHPAYPGTGTKSFDNCRNYTVRPNLPREEYRKTAARAVAELKAYDPDLVIVSAGFDAYAGDPLCNQKLSAEDFRWFGKTLGGLGLPVASAMEGGYSDDLPDLVLAYLRGLLGK